MPDVRASGEAATGEGYDTSRVHVRGVYIFFIGFAATMVVLLVGVWFFQRGLVGPVRTEDVGAPRQVPPLPQPLQPSVGHPALPWQDLAALRARQERQLHSAGPLPSDPGRRHISIEDAMDQLLRSGVLEQPWENPSTLPFVRPPGEPALPSVENRT